MSESEERCTKCRVAFDDEIRSIALSEDTRSDSIGPLSLKAAKVLLWVFMALLLVAFVVVTEFGSVLAA